MKLASFNANNKPSYGVLSGDALLERAMPFEVVMRTCEPSSLLVLWRS